MGASVGGTAGFSTVNTVTSTDTQTTDLSRSYSLGDYSGGTSVGLRINAGDLSGATINNVDPGAIMAAESVARASISGAESMASRIAGTASLAIDKAFGLAGQASQTDTQAVLGALVKVALAIAGLGIVGAFLYYMKKRGN